MRLLRLFAAAVLVLGPAAGIAHAVTIPQLVALMREGLSDDVLVSLIETDGSTFQLTAADILSLHRQGLSDKVILAMQKTAKKMPAPSSEPEVIQQVVQPAPSVVNVYQTVTQKVEPGYGGFAPVYAVPVAVPVVVRPSVVRPAQPVYWGWGGQRRPDSWQDRPDANRSKPEDNKDDKKKSGGS